MRRRKPAFLPIAIALALIASSNACPALAEETPTGSDLVLILDASGSMWGQIDGENKIVIARRVLADVLGKVPDGANVGLVAYGHRREADCNDIEIVVPTGPIDRTALIKKIDSLNPKGKTPITASLNMVFDDLVEHSRPATVVLVSDGLETCNADPCQAVRDAKAKGIKFVMHVIGFDVGDVDVSQLECAAQAGGGLYLGAADAGQFTAALGQAVAMTPESPTGSLAVKATKGGELLDVLLEVRQTGADDVAASARTYESAESNPRVIPLEEGSYEVTAKAVRIEGSPEKTLTGIVIENGKTVERTVDFSSGKLRVKVTRNGALSDAAVRVLRPGTRQQVAGKRTYVSPETNPAEIELAAGSYDVEAGSIEIAGEPRQRWENVFIGGEKPVELAHEFASGTLRIGARRGAELIDAAVHIRDAANTAVDGARTYTDAKSNPRSFTLTPGNYKVSVTPVKKDGGAKRELAVTVEAGGTVEEIVDFGQ